MAVGCAGLEARDAIAKMLRVEIGGQHRKAIGHMQARATLRVFIHNLDRAMTHFADFTHHHDVIILIRQCAQAFQKLDVFRARFVVDIVLHAIEICRHVLWRGLPRQVRAQLLIVEVVVHRIKPEDVKSAIQSELSSL